jgi:hypothetical protein
MQQPVFELLPSIIPFLNMLVIVVIISIVISILTVVITNDEKRTGLTIFIAILGAIGWGFLLGGLIDAFGSVFGSRKRG